MASRAQHTQRRLFFRQLKREMAMAKLNWSNARSFNSTEQAFPGNPADTHYRRIRHVYHSQITCPCGHTATLSLDIRKASALKCSVCGNKKALTIKEMA